MYTYKAIVKRVIDGDTLVLDIDLGFNVWTRDDHFRLFGINAFGLRSKIPTEKELAKKAKARLMELCPDGSVMTVVVNKTKEKYGRYLVVIEYPKYGTTVNELLVVEGLAKYYFGDGKAE